MILKRLFVFIQFSILVFGRSTELKLCISQYQSTEVIRKLRQTETCCGGLSEMWFDLLGGQTTCVWVLLHVCLVSGERLVPVLLL